MKNLTKEINLKALNGFGKFWIAFTVIVGFMGLSIWTDKEISQTLNNVMIMIVSFYFGAVATNQEQSTETQPPKDTPTLSKQKMKDIKALEELAKQLQ